MKSKFLLFLTLGWILCAQNIYAQWCGTPCCTPCYDNWSGIYVGVNGGISWGHNKYQFFPGGGGIAIFTSVENSSFRQKPREGVLGVHFGFNKQFSCFLVGLESFIDGIWFEETSHNVFFTQGPIFNLVPQTSFNTELQAISTITPRLGFTSGCWLFYVKGGLTAAIVKSSLRSTIRSGQFSQPTTFNRRQYHVGWTYGVGIEYLCGCHWIVGIEYDYHRFGKETYGGETSVQPASFAPMSYEVRPRRSMALLRISYKI